MDHLIEELPDRLEKELQTLLTAEEKVIIKIKGAFKQALICTTHRVIVAKGGFMTGQFFGNNVFQLPYARVAGVEVKYGLLSGYFELSAGGMQNTDKSYWSQAKGTDPAKAPNCVSLNTKAMAQKFRDATAYILDRASTSGMHAQVAPAMQEPKGGSHESILKAVSGLKDLHSAGVLTDDEFENKKRELLARM
jgi:hypothetical protein